MIITSFAEMSQSLHKNTPAALLLCGSDAFCIEAAVETVRAHFADFSRLVLQAKELTLEKLDELLFAPSFFVQKQLLIIQECDALKDKKYACVLRYLQHPNPNMLVLFVSGEILKSAPLYKELLSNHLVVHFAKKAPWEKYDEIVRWIEHFVTNNNRRIEPKACHALARSCSGNYWALVHELDKLMTYARDDDQIDTKMLAKLSTLCEENTLWQLSDAMYQQDAKTILSMLANIQKNDMYPLVVIRHLRNSISQTFNIASRMYYREPPDSIREHFPKLQGRLFEKAYNLARRFTLGQLKKGLHLLDSAQMQLKDAQVDERTLLQTLLLKLRHALLTP